MAIDKGMFNFFNEFVFPDRSEGGVDVNVDVLRKNVIKTIFIKQSQQVEY